MQEEENNAEKQKEHVKHCVTQLARAEKLVASRGKMSSQRAREATASPTSLFRESWRKIDF